LKATVNLTVNGEDYELEVPPQTTLLDLLRPPAPPRPSPTPSTMPGGCG
jgi:hypothetical protein